MPSESIINLLVQVPLVGIFIWFVLQITRSERTERQAMATAAKEEREKRDTEWRLFLAEQREAANSSTARLAEEIKSIGMSVAAVHSLMLTHDQRVSIAVPKMQQAVEEITKQRPRGPAK